MNFKLGKKTLAVSAIILLSGAALAFAHGGYGGGRGYDDDGYGHHMRWGGGHMMGYGPGAMMGGDGYGRHMRGDGYGYGRGYGDDLSKEDAAKLDAAREKFFKETRELRDQMEDKRIDLGQELRKETPDAAMAAKLQKELSQLESQFDEKALAHRLEMRKLLPENFQGRRHYGRGFGYDGGCR